MSNESRPEVLNGETRLIFTHDRTGQVIHQSWAETAFAAIPREGERVSLVISEGRKDDDAGEWKVRENDSILLLVKEVEYSYNYVRFQDEEESINVQRLLTDVWIHAEPLAAVEEPE